MWRIKENWFANWNVLNFIGKSDWIMDFSMPLFTFNPQFYLFIYLFINWLIDWFTDSFVDWFIDLLIHLLIDWLIYWFICWLIDWFTDWFVDWLIDLLNVFGYRTDRRSKSSHRSIDGIIPGIRDAVAPLPRRRWGKGRRACRREGIPRLRRVEQQQLGRNTGQRPFQPRLSVAR